MLWKIFPCGISLNKKMLNKIYSKFSQGRLFNQHDVNPFHCNSSLILLLFFHSLLHVFLFFCENCTNIETYVYDFHVPHPPLDEVCSIHEWKFLVHVHTLQLLDFTLNIIKISFLLLSLALPTNSHTFFSD